MGNSLDKLPWMLDAVCSGTEYRSGSRQSDTRLDCPSVTLWLHESDITGPQHNGKGVKILACPIDTQKSKHGSAQLIEVLQYLTHSLVVWIIVMIVQFSATCKQVSLESHFEWTCEFWMHFYSLKQG